MENINDYVNKQIDEAVAAIKDENKEVIKIEIDEPKIENEDKVLTEVERLYVKVLNNSIDIMYRPTHSYLEFVNDDDNGLKRIKELLNMSRDEFSKYLKENKLFRSQKDVLSIYNTDKEKWYNGAWNSQTVSYFKIHNLSNIIEKYIEL